MSEKKKTYKNSIEALELIIDKIESGNIEIDELSTLVKDAAELIKSCKLKLRNTEIELNQFLDSSDD